MEISRTSKVVVVAALVAVGFALRAYGLSAPGLSEDEVNKVEAARGYMAGDFSQNLEHPMLMKSEIAACLAATDAWNARVDEASWIPEEVPVRLPNVVFGALTTVAIFLFAELMFGTNVALFAAALWATGVSAITVNRIAKEDTLVVFFFWFCLYFYERAKRLGASHVPAQCRFYGAAGACLGLMLASKYYPQFWAMLFVYYHLLGRDETNQPLTRRDYAWFYGAFAAFFVAFNPTVLLPTTLEYFVRYTREQTLTHHGYLLMGTLYPNNPSATPWGLPVYFYPLLFALKTPIVVLLAFFAGLCVALRRRSQRGYFFVIFMFVIWIVPYSLFAAKFLRYILTLMPVIYLCAAIGVVAVFEFVSNLTIFRSRVGARTVLATLLTIAIVVSPALSATSSAPFYSLYLNPLGMGRTGFYFPHDEFYDAGLREAIKAICDEAPPNAVVFGEAPPVFHYYQRKFGREDLRFHQMSDISAPTASGSPAYIVVQDGRKYFENVSYVDNIESSMAPFETIRIGGADAARIYRMPDAPELIKAR